MSVSKQINLFSVGACLCAPAAGTAASESPSSGVKWYEASGLPESEHSSGDDAGVGVLFAHHHHHHISDNQSLPLGLSGPIREGETLTDAMLFFQDEEAEGGDGGSCQRAGGEQPLLREVG